MNNSFNRITKELVDDIESVFIRCGLFYRIFYRTKAIESIDRKIVEKKYGTISNENLLQDLIGIRIVLYFNDDLPIVYSYLISVNNFLNETIDQSKVTEFKPTRINLIFRLTEPYSEEILETLKQKYKNIDTTYEIQLRTILAEGWHEVEHDLKYKCEEDWDNEYELSRAFNGIHASLISNDWSIIAIFDKLAYKHYRKNNWNAMLRCKFRIRFKDSKLSNEINQILISKPELVKRIFKINRADLIKIIIFDRIKVPLTLTNVIFIINAYYLHDDKLRSITPEFILENKSISKALNKSL